MLDEVKLDGVVVSTADHTHAVIGLAAMERGKHLYCEKPMTWNLADGDQVVRKANETGRKVAVAHQAVLPLVGPVDQGVVAMVAMQVLVVLVTKRIPLVVVQVMAMLVEMLKPMVVTLVVAEAVLVLPEQMVQLLALPAVLVVLANYLLVLRLMAQRQAL